MKLLPIAFACACCVFISSVHAQVKPATESQRNNQSFDKRRLSSTSCDTAWNDDAPYIRITANNDFFKLRGTTDRYYTNGEKLEVYFPLGKAVNYGLMLFPHFAASGTSNNLFAVTVGMDMFTPTNIKEAGVLYGDRPYAGYSFLGLKCVSSDFNVAGRLTTEYQFGVIGPAARQKEVQTAIHKAFGFQKPMGWDNQIANDAALNINIQYDAMLFNPVTHMEVIGNVEANLGTVTNYVGLSGLLRLGAFNDYFLNEYGLRAGDQKVARYRQCASRREIDDDTKSPDSGRHYFSRNMNREFQLYLFAKPQLRFVLDNSLLEGGLTTSETCVYTIPADDVQHIVFGGEFGVNLIYRGVGIIFSQLVRSPEFKDAKTSHWGSLSLIFKIW
jgi:hypothetical protein